MKKIRPYENNSIFLSKIDGGNLKKKKKKNQKKTKNYAGKNKTLVGLFDKKLFINIL